MHVHPSQNPTVAFITEMKNTSPTNIGIVTNLLKVPKFDNGKDVLNKHCIAQNSITIHLYPHCSKLLKNGNAKMQ
jgi:hypothetical protein